MEMYLWRYSMACNAWDQPLLDPVWRWPTAELHIVGACQGGELSGRAAACGAVGLARAQLDSSEGRCP